MSARRWRGFVIGATLIVAALLVGLGIAEYVSRSIYADMVEKLIDVDHRMKPNARGRNADGIRSTVDPADLRDEDVNVIFLGDSFAFGVRSPAERALPQRLESMARAAMPRETVNVLNFGWSSSSPYLSNRLLRNIGSKYKPDAVILLVDATDFYDDMAHRKYIEKNGIYALLDYVPGLFYVVRTVAKRELAPRPSNRCSTFRPTASLPMTSLSTRRAQCCGRSPTVSTRSPPSPATSSERGSISC